MRLTAPLPLRTTAGWEEYTETLALPVVYGRVTLSPMRYDASGHLWLIADHPIGGVDRVGIAGVESAAWALQNGTDHNGEPVAVLETQAQIENAVDLAVTVRGALHPQTGALLDRPDLVLWDLLNRVAGYTLDYSDLDDLRAWAQTQGIAIGGILDSTELSIQGAVDSFCRGCGLAWSSEATGFAFPWPGALESNYIHSIADADDPNLVAICDGRDIFTIVEVAYSYDWAAADHTATVTLRSPSAIERYGEIRQRIEAPWLRNARDAIAYGTRWLQWHARPVWEISARVGLSDATIGESIEIDHRYSPVSVAVLTGRNIGETSEHLILQGPAGAVPAITQVGTTGRVDANLKTQPEALVSTGTIEARFTRPDGKPLAAARVMLDGAFGATTNVSGEVLFIGVSSGQHTLVATSVGLAPQIVTVTVP